jgi:hypothetical protein
MALRSPSAQSLFATIIKLLPQSVVDVLLSKPSFWLGGLLSGLSLFVEEARRRPELAMYVLPKGLESVWVMARGKRLVPKTGQYGEALVSRTFEMFRIRTDLDFSSLQSVWEWLWYVYMISLIIYTYAIVHRASIRTIHSTCQGLFEGYCISLSAPIKFAERSHVVLDMFAIIVCNTDHFIRLFIGQTYT